MKILTILLCLIILSSTAYAEDGIIQKLTGFLSKVIDYVKNIVNPNSSTEVKLRHGQLFDFSTANLEAKYPDCDLEETPFAEAGTIQKAGLRTCKGKDDIANMGAVNFNSVTIPSPNSFTSNPQAIVGNVYIIKTHSGGYAKIQVSTVHDMETISFKWAKMSGSWKSKPKGGLVTVKVDENTTVDCDTSIDEKTAYQQYIQSYNKLTSLMQSRQGDTTAAKNAYTAYAKDKACYEKISE